MTAEASLTTKPSLTLKRHFNASPEKSTRPGPTQKKF